MNQELHYAIVIRTFLRGTFVEYVTIQLGYMLAVTLKALLGGRVNGVVQRRLGFLMDLVVYYQFDSATK